MHVLPEPVLGDLAIHSQRGLPEPEGADHVHLHGGLDGELEHDWSPDPLSVFSTALGGKKLYSN
jgi:hypothetical protein